ncbi:uncharacterized protein LOC118506697 isoform X2 [Anopheles stephensi]|uniref:uncharacterized protein LOC118506697 isoform X2 n=1 Tax=Anopheles stephensi TaxID=30069 RepID=UPI0016588733|nr:uncharacterized protein LOC118506697 isoform X2 [Anopheles stephensi]
MSDKSTPSVPASECSSSTIEQENRCTAPTKTIQMDRDEHHDAAKKPDVFERNYQFARIYQDRRRALTAKMEANETGQRCFKAQPIRIVEFREAEKKLKFTVPTTPEVMKHNFNKRPAKE